MRSLFPLFTGSVGLGGLEAVTSIEVPASHDTSEIIKIVLQVVVSLATLFGLFKKKREKTI